MGTLGTLAVSIVGDASGLNKTLDGAAGKFQNTGKKIGKAGGSLTRNVTLPLLAIGGAIGAAMIKYGNFADQMLDLSAITGMSTDDLQKWRSVAVDAGVDVDATASAMERFNKRMERGADVAPAMQEAIEGMNMSVDEFRDLNADEKMREMMQAMADMDKEERVAFANKMNIPELLPMVEDVIEKGGDVEEVLRNIDPAFSEEDLETMNEFRQSWDNLKESIFLLIGEALIPLFEWFKENREMIEGKFKGALEGIGDTIGKLAEWWQNLAPGMQDFIKRAVVVAVVLGPILIVVGKVIGIIGALLPVLKLVAGAFLLLTSPIGLIIAAIAGLVAAFIYLWNNNEAFRDGVIAIWEGIKAAAMAVFGALQKFWDKWGDSIIAIFKIAWDQVKNIFETVVAIITNIFKLFTAVLTGDWEGAGEALKNIAMAIFDFFKGTFENLSKALAIVWEAMGDILSGLWDDAKTKLMDGAKAIYDGVKGWFESLSDSVRGVIRGMVNAVIELFNSMISRLNRLSISIPDWVPHYGGQSFSPNIPNIPKLARGGDITQAGWAMVGERGPELLRLPEGASVRPLDSGSQTININATYNVTDQATAEYANNDLVKKLKRVGLGGANR